ncbi:MAG: hypothetical protein COA44_13010 [Arcobacter sp.]|nr:MAG: hypothetical protein COA44_13010 [Arcobacter sp.]
MRIIITLALLFSFAFSTVHEYTFAFYDEGHCSASEYAQELQSPSEHDDICDIHFEYHHAYILTSNTHLLPRSFRAVKLAQLNETYTYQTTLKFTKPPIS